MRTQKKGPAGELQPPRRHKQKSSRGKIDAAAKAVKGKQRERGGFVPIPRWLLQAELRSGAKLSRLEAVLDLVQMSRYGDGKGVVRVAGHEYGVEPGQVVTTVRILAVRWGWSKSRVHRSLAAWDTERLISGRPAGHQATRLTLCRRLRCTEARDTERDTRRDTKAPKTERIKNKDPEGQGKKKKREEARARAREAPPSSTPSASPHKDEDRHKAEDDVPLPTIDPSAFPSTPHGNRLFAEALRPLAARVCLYTPGPHFVDQVLLTLDERVSRCSILHKLAAEAGRSVRREYWPLLDELRAAQKVAPARRPVTVGDVADQRRMLVAQLSAIHPEIDVPALTQDEAGGLAILLTDRGKTPLDLHKAVKRIVDRPSKLNGDFVKAVLEMMDLSESEPRAHNPEDEAAVAAACKASLGLPDDENADERGGDDLDEPAEVPKDEPLGDEIDAPPSIYRDEPTQDENDDEHVKVYDGGCGVLSESGAVDRAC